ncbi:hypothetical protein [Bacillus paramobilis]|nr:hypothetical protein [Bacillus paramobilis]
MEFLEAFVRGLVFGIGWISVDMLLTKIASKIKSKKVKGQA